MTIFYTDSGSFNDISVSGSLLISGNLSFTQNSGGLTGSLFGTSSWANSASVIDFTGITNKPELVSSSGQISITATNGYSTFSSSIATKNDLQDISINALNAATSSYAINSTIQTQLAGVISSSTQFNALTNTSASFASTASFVNTLATLTASNVQLDNLTDTTSTNKVLVLNTATNQVFTTASAGGGGSVPPGTISQSLSGDAQGQIKLNGVNVDITNLQTNDSPSFTGLTVDNDGLFVDPTADRVGIGTTIPTARLTVNGNTDVSGSITATGGTHFLGKNIGGSEVGLTLGDGRTANGFAYIDLVGDTTYTDYGLRIIRDNTGANAPTKFLHRGTGNIEYYSSEPADIVWITDNATRMTVKGLGGFVGLNKTNPSARLDILGDQIISGSLTVSSSGAGISSINVTGSVNILGNMTASAGFFGTSSWATNAISASYFSGSATFPDGLTVTNLTASNVQVTAIATTSSQALYIAGFDQTTNTLFETTTPLIRPVTASFDTGTGATFTKPADANWLQIELWGGGGSGARGANNAPGGGGGGGAYNTITIPFSYAVGAITYTVGAGGARQTAVSTAGNGGGTTSVSIANFRGTGTTLTISAFGGGSGGYNTTGGGGGGGGGTLGAGANVTTLNAGGAGGSPTGFAAGTNNGDNPGFGGGAGSTGANAVIGRGGNSYYGGGGGGGGSDSTQGGPGGSSVYGGGGGGGGASTGAGGAAGTSVYGGNGSAGTTGNVATSADGTVPGGGTGGTEEGTAAGTGLGGSGRVRFTYW